jgi:hypothetical protein
MKRAPLTLTLTLALSIAGCGYFNSMYNANREFANAERARERGDAAAARTAYAASIEKAAKSYRRYPNGRWADDALYLIARARFELREYAAARAAFTELLSKNTDAQMRARAHAYLGASNVALASTDAGLMQLDSALAQLDRQGDLAGFAHHWRARARAAAGDVAGAWTDLDAVQSPADPEYTAVQIERIVLGITSSDSARTTAAFTALLTSPAAYRRLDTLNKLVTSAVTRFGANAARVMITQPQVDWLGASRDSLTLLRAQLAAGAGDTAAAYHDLQQLTERSSAIMSASARVALARSRLTHVNNLDQLFDIRSLLLPAIANNEAPALITSIRMVEVLVQRAASTGQPLALFTAAEIARDELRAPALARKLFVTFAEVGTQTPWAGKALLAALALDPDHQDASTLRARLAALPANPYSAAVRGESAEEAYTLAETRLSRSMIALRSEAAQLAKDRESAVMRATFELDSIKLAARADTIRAGCGVMIDTLALSGIRADSVRTACVRGDKAVLAAYLKADTMKWKVMSPLDSLRARQKRGKVGTDTIK